MTFDPLDVEGIARKNLTMFYLIDSSGSMAGERIGAINTIMDEVLPELRNVGGADSDINIAVLQFADHCNWITPKPESIETFKWKTIYANGLTALGEACLELNDKLSREKFMNTPSVSFAPVIMLMTDGYATDDYYKGLDVLKQNGWFKSALKIAINIDDGADVPTLEAFTGNRELVIRTNGGKQLADMIRFVSVTSSQITSRPRLDGNEGSVLTPEEANEMKTNQMVNSIRKFGSVDPRDIDHDDDFL